jgi:hypothetical protein
MDVLGSNSMTDVQARTMLQGDQVLRAARGLGTETDRAQGQSVEEAQQREKLLRQRADEFVGITFYGTLMKLMRNSSLKGPYGHGGRGEEVFGGQLDMVLAQRMGEASRFDLGQAVYRQLGGRGSVKATTSADVQREES